MTNARWARAALVAAAVTACACAHGAARPETTMSYRGGQSAQPSSWLPGIEAISDSNVVSSGDGPAGQAAQQYSWIGDSDLVTPAPSALAKDSVPVGRAAQPQSWTSVRATTPADTSLASSSSTARQ